MMIYGVQAKVSIEQLFTRESASGLAITLLIMGILFPLLQSLGKKYCPLSAKNGEGIDGISDPTYFGLFSLFFFGKMKNSEVSGNLVLPSFC
jgi:hypothetical protein